MDTPKQEPPKTIALLKPQQERLRSIDNAIRQLEQQRNIMLQTIAECNGVNENATYAINDERTMLTYVPASGDPAPNPQAASPLSPEPAPDNKPN